MSEFSRNLAFIIGINNYTNGISSLQNAGNDAKKLVEILREKHEYKVWVCLDEVATLNNLNKLLEKILPEQVSENDRLLFYFAGHGIALNGDDGPEGYLIPQDAKLGDVQTYLPMTKLQESLNKLPCRHFLGILDCCFAGAFRWSSNRDLLTTPEVIHKERYDRFITDPAWQVITSAASDQKALDAFALNSERGQRGTHSPFAAALIEALAGKADAYPPSTNGKSPGDGVITATELYLYLRDAVEPATEGNRQRQTPGIWPLKKHDKGEYIFLAPGHPLNLPPAPPLDASKNPYRGLESFDEEHSELFFGRSKLVKKLHNCVQIQPLTVVLGASGSGKSSLVKAGLIPQLRQDHTEKWEILEPIRPGETPLQALNNALKNAQLPEVAAQDLQQSLAMSIDTWAKNHPNSKLLLFIDQSEEIITLCQNEDERKEFFQQILKAINVHRDRLRVVLSLRSDFEPQIRDAGLKFVPTVMKVGNTVLKNRWHTGRFIVPAMTRGELREAIEKPAEARVMYFQPHELVEQLIDEVDNMPGALPLLSFALSELYLKYLNRQREAENGGITIDRALTQADYQDLGGVIQSLTQRADEEYEALVKENPAYAQIIRHVMLRMVAIGGGELARRQVPLSELEYPAEKNGLVKEVIERFTNARLLVKGEDAIGNPYVEPAHDALIRGWQKLLNWVKEEKNLRLQRRLTPAAFEWKSQQQAGFLWNADPYLDVLHKDVLNSQNNWLDKVETEFVQRSIWQRRRNTYLRWGITISVMLGLSVLTFLSLIGQRNALMGQIRANRQSAETNLPNQELDALLESLRAGKSLKNWPGYLSLLKPESKLPFLKPDHELQPQVLRTLRKISYVAKERNRIEVPQDFTKMFFAPDDTLQIATAGSDGIVHIQDLKGNKRSKVFSGHKGKVTLDVNRDSSLLASIDEQGTVRLWNLEGIQEELPKLVVSIPQSTFSKVDSSGIEFSPDGKKLVAFVKGKVKSNQKSDGITYLWDLSGNEPKLLKHARGYFSDINFNFNNQLIVATHPEFTTIYLSDFMSGKRLADLSAAYFIPDCGDIVKFYFTHDNISAAICGGTVRVKKLDDESPWKVFEPASGEEKSINFDAIGRLIVRHNYKGTISIYDSYLSEDKLQLELKGHQGEADQVISSSNGKRFASKGDDNTIRLWDIEDKPVTQLRSIPNLTSISISPDGKQVAVVESDGTVRLLDLNANELKRFVDVQGKISQIIFSPVEQKLAAVGKDSTIRLLDLNGKELYKSQNFEKPINQLIFSPNGQQLAFVENNNTYESTSSIYLLNLNNKPWKPLPYKFNPTYNRMESYQSITFSSDSKSLLVAGPKFVSIDGPNRTSYSLKELESTKELANFESEYFFSRISLNTKVSLLASAADESIYLWDMSGKLLTSFKSQQPGKVTSISLSADGSLLATLSEDGTAILWRIGDFDELLEQSCNWVRDYLATLDENNSDRHLCDNVKK